MFYFLLIFPQQNVPETILKFILSPDSVFLKHNKWEKGSQSDHAHKCVHTYVCVCVRKHALAQPKTMPESHLLLLNLSLALCFLLSSSLVLHLPLSLLLNLPLAKFLLLSPVAVMGSQSVLLLCLSPKPANHVTVTIIIVLSGCYCHSTVHPNIKSVTVLCPTLLLAVIYWRNKIHSLSIFEGFIWPMITQKITTDGQN